jgi:predicted chitinase
MGTTEDGTSHIGLLADYLGSVAHHVAWTAQFIESDPMTPQQKDDLWTRLVSSVNAGFPVPMNWDAPAGWGPQAVLPNEGGRVAPDQPGYYGHVMHYVCAVGYVENESGRYVVIADSGFAPWQYAVRFDNRPGDSGGSACSLIPCKGYVWSAAAPVGVPTLPGPTTELSLAEKLSYAMDEGLTLAEYEQILPHVLASLEACQCNTRERVAMWMAQVGHESCGLKYAEEIGDAAYFSQYNDRADLGNRPGTNDGVVYHGRSYIQTTGRTNYEQLSQWCFEQGYVPTPTFFVDQPPALATPDYAFQGVNYYWVFARGSAINDAADRGDINEATRLINGGYNGLEDRQARYTRALTVADAFLPTAAPALPPESAMVINPPAPAKTETCLTGRPHHHSENAATEQQVLDIRAEGLITQALVFAIAEKLGVDAHSIYDAARNSF